MAVLFSLAFAAMCRSLPPHVPVKGPHLPGKCCPFAVCTRYICSVRGSQWLCKRVVFAAKSVLFNHVLVAHKRAWPRVMCWWCVWYVLHTKYSHFSRHDSFCSEFVSFWGFDMQISYRLTWAWILIIYDFIWLRTIILITLPRCQDAAKYCKYYIVRLKDIQTKGLWAVFSTNSRRSPWRATP